MKPNRKAQRLVEKGLGLHQGGDIEGAIALYRQALTKDARNFDGLHLLGVAYRQTGRTSEGLALIEKAIKVREDVPEVHNNLADTLKFMGRIPEAEAAYRRAIELRPGFFEAYNNLGALLHETKRTDEARIAFERAIELNPLGAEALSNLGLMQKDGGEAEAAVETYRRVTETQPGIAEAHANLGQALKGMKRYEEAIAAFRRAIEINPALFEPQNNLGSTLLDMKRSAEAEVELRKAIAIDPRHPSGHNNLGIALMNQGRTDEAIASFEAALAIDPDHADALNNCGVAWLDALDPAKALDCYRHAQRSRVDFAEAAWNESIALLLTGDFENGWQKYEARWRSDRFPSPRRDFDKPLWLGRSDPTGKTILVHAEQGLGDVIQFLRYVPLVCAIGGNVIFELQPALCAMVKALQLPLRIVPAGAPLPDFDMHIPLLSLPLAFDTRMETIPVVQAYLFADQIKAGIWRSRLGTSRGMRVGLVWSGNATHAKDSERSLPFTAFAPILETPGVEFVSLQKDVRASDVAALAASKVRNFASDLNDFGDTAALIAGLDLVICVDTSVAHLAGAMGKPVWILNAHLPDWRWMLGRSDTPWYPSARLYRQSKPRDWSSVIDEVTRDLGERARARVAA